MTDRRHAQRVDWFDRDPGGTTIHVTPPTNDLDALHAQRREELGLEPGESDPSRALGLVLLIFAAAAVAGVWVLGWVLWR